MDLAISPLTLSATGGSWQGDGEARKHMQPAGRLRNGERLPGHRLPGAIALALSFSLLAACQSAPGSLAWLAGSPGVRAAGGSHGPRALDATLRCRVLFPGEAGPGDRQVQATAAQVTREATVALLDTATGKTLAAGRTDVNGNATLAPGSSFVPAPGFYHLRVIAPAGRAAGSGLVSMATVVRWTAAGWTSITNGTGGSGQIAVNPTTTAVVLIQASDPETSTGGTGFDDIMGVVSGTDYTTVTAFTTHTGAEVTARATEVAKKLAQSTDPLGNALLAATVRLAPGDTGDPTVHHDYLLKKGEVESTFVWIPVFEAYQLINPGNCGYDPTTTPVGAWVAARPSGCTEAPAGTDSGDWARERFGGFYAAKYEASRADATPGNPSTGAGATSGGSNTTTLKVARYCVPWVDINWDAAANAAISYHPPHSHLMRDDEWTALAVWSMIQGLTVYGNNNLLKDYDDGSGIDKITFTAAPNRGGLALTGTGTRSDWSGSTKNLTTHTGTTAGVSDLNGNVCEWTASLGAASTSGNYVVNDITLPVSVPGDYISQLSTAPRLRRYGVPGATTGMTAFFGNDLLQKNPINAKPQRGGAWASAGTAGVWALNLIFVRSLSDASFGFRPAIRF